MICWKCGAENDPNARQCAKCGERLRSQLAVEQQGCAKHPWRIAVSTCHACGLELCEDCEVLIDRTSYCRECADRPTEEELLRNVPVVDPARAEPAGLPARALAAAMDLLVLASAFTVLWIASWLVVGDPSVPLDTGDHPWAHAAFWSIVAVGVPSYFIQSVAASAQTPGMAAVDIAVIRDTGEAPDRRTAAVRFLALLPAALSIAGILCCVWDRQGRMLHDRLSRTRVIRMG